MIPQIPISQCPKIPANQQRRRPRPKILKDLARQEVEVRQMGLIRRKIRKEEDRKMMREEIILRGQIVLTLLRHQSRRILGTMMMKAMKTVKPIKPGTLRNRQNLEQKDFTI